MVADLHGKQEIQSSNPGSGKNVSLEILMLRNFYKMVGTETFNNAMVFYSVRSER